MAYLHDLVLLLILAKTLGIPLKKIGIHPVVGHVVAGIILGPYILGIVTPSKELETIAGVALLLLLFYTGLTTDFRELRRQGLHIIVMGCAGVAVTFGLVYGLLYLIGMRGLQLFFIAIALSNTATETVAAIIARVGGRELRALVVGASFVDDIIAVFIISITASMKLGVETNLVYLSIATTIYMVGALALSQLLVKKASFFYKQLSRDYLIFASTSLILAFALALLAEEIGLSTLIGAYLAGLIIGRGREFHDPLIRTRVILTEFIDDLSIVLEALFVPMFFTFVGLLLNPQAISIQIYIVGLLAAVLGKIISCTPIAYHSLKDLRRGLAAGVAMVGRGALETALLKLGLDAGILDISTYSTVIVIAISTTIIAPLLYSIVYPSRR